MTRIVTITAEMMDTKVFGATGRRWPEIGKAVSDQSTPPPLKIVDYWRDLDTDALVVMLEDA